MNRLATLLSLLLLLSSLLSYAATRNHQEAVRISGGYQWQVTARNSAIINDNGIGRLIHSVNQAGISIRISSLPFSRDGINFLVELWRIENRRYYRLSASDGKPANRIAGSALGISDCPTSFADANERAVLKLGYTDPPSVFLVDGVQRSGMPTLLFAPNKEGRNG